MTAPDLIIHNARITTQTAELTEAASLAVTAGAISALDPPLTAAGPQTLVIDGAGRRLVPGLFDTHIHVIRGGLNYNLELRWDGVTSLADALRMLKDQAQRTPPGQWVRVVGGWSEFQFAEKRMPTLAELNAAAPETPVFILHLYCRALLNRAALRAVGYTRDTPNPPGGEIERDRRGEPTGLLLARPNAMILYATLAKGPKLPPEHQLNSTRHFMRELNRLGVTSIIDAGGGFQNYPEDYAVIDELHKNDELTLRIAYNLFTQKPKEERADFVRWMSMTGPGRGDAMLRCNGAGEMLVFSAADFEDFLEPRPELAPSLEDELFEVVKLLAEHRWPFRLHATYDESISRFLDVFEKVDREVPFNGLHWFFDHCETISQANLERVKALGGGIAIQHRMAYQGEYFVARYGAEAAARTPPVKRMLELDLPVAAGTDATRVASYNPWVALAWLVTGSTVGGTRLYPEDDCIERAKALQLYTQAGTWFANEDPAKGTLAVGAPADFALLSDDYFKVPATAIKDLHSVLTVLAGRVVYAAPPFADFAPPPLPVLPEWSPTRVFGGYGAPLDPRRAARAGVPHQHNAQCSQGCLHAWRTLLERAHAPHCQQGFFGGGCDCFAF